MVKRPHVGTDKAREREHRIEVARFDRAHVIELTYLSLVDAVALGIISFFIEPPWTWFVRGMVAGLILTSLYVLSRAAMHHPIRRYFSHH
jgi:hypothetical protein